VKKATVHAIPIEPDGSGVLEVLKDAQALADKGDISMIAVTIVDREGSTHMMRSKVHFRAALVGALAMQQFRLIRQGEE
jgi:hypothetical protein